VVIEYQKHADYQASMAWLLDAVSAWARRRGAPGAVPAARAARTLRGRRAAAAVFDAAAVLAKDAQNDAGLRAWWADVGAYMRKVLLPAGYIIEPACTSRAQGLRDQGQGIYQDKYSGHFDNLFDAAATWVTSIAADPLNTQFGADWARLTRDLLYDGEGNLQFKKRLWRTYVPIPRFEYSDAGLDLLIENLTLSGRNLFPNIVAVEAHNYVRFSPYEVTFTFVQMQADIRGVAFYFRTKTGIRMSDAGCADVLLGVVPAPPLLVADGFVQATVSLASSAAPDPTSVFTVQCVRVMLGALRFSIRDSKHNLSS
ncbi:hypothetical protein FB451DRAFT_1434439, partial [Mycena latifolia]